MRDIVERLRALTYEEEILEEAAVEIERQKASAEYWRGEAVRAADALSELRADNERLRAALETIEEETERTCRQCRMIEELARAALEPKP